MRLYLFEHCSLCFRVRMIAALKHLHLQEMVVLEDDSETMIGLVGKRVVPILVKDDGEPKRLPWEDWRPGEAEHTSAWVRATAPNGLAAYEGRVAWSGELGFGVRAPEAGQTAEAPPDEAFRRAEDAVERLVEHELEDAVEPVDDADAEAHH